jgi:hypothetical protein
MGRAPLRLAAQDEGRKPGIVSSWDDARRRLGGLWPLTALAVAVSLWVLIVWSVIRYTG